MHRTLALCLLLAAPFAPAHAADPSMGWAGASGASWHWIVPETPNGLKPNQSWHATASAPDGYTYVAGMDHTTNAALYRIEQSSGRLEFVGDARSASEAANNWAPGETVEKFHTRPLWHKGQIYVASMKSSTLDNTYLGQRGFHWYAFNPGQKSFVDLSAKEPGGVGAEHGSVVAIASDPAHNLIYGAGLPTAEIFRYDVAAGRTENLGRPRAFDRPFTYTGRVIWVDSRGRLYFTAGNPRLGPQDESIYGHVHFYDPKTGFGERRDWRLHQPRALEAGQCFDGGKRCYFTDDIGNLYRFDDAGPHWREIGQIAHRDPWAFVWMFQVSPDERTIYAATSLGKNKSGLFAFDIGSGETQRLGDVADLDPALSDYQVHTGSGAFDAQGRFYFTSFVSGDGKLIINRVDPAALKNGLGRK